MATADRAFTGSSSVAIAARILAEEPVPPRRLVASIPAQLEGIILRCLQKDPARRYQTMGEVKVALEDAQRAMIGGISLRLPSRRSAWATAILALAVAGFVVWNHVECRKRHRRCPRRLSH
jgi:eukaryotic-like serine/threonine-protein kinase